MTPSKLMPLCNILSIDLEDWYHAQLPHVGPPPNLEPTGRLKREVAWLLDVCDRTRASATFFVVANIAEHDPWFVQCPLSRGHEIGCHSYRHTAVWSMSLGEFRADIVFALEALEHAGAARVVGFRAPYWSLDHTQTDYMAVLTELGFAYDSSVFPIRTFAYGDAHAPRFPFRSRAGIMEFPASTVRILGRRLSFFGGAYFRTAPYAAISWGIRRINAEGYPAIIYLHPREIDPRQRRPVGPMRDRVALGWNIWGTRSKLVRLLNEFRFVSFERYLQLSVTDMSSSVPW